MPSCSECIHIKTCAIYKAIVLTKNSFDAEFKELGVSLPMAPETIGLNCPHFLSPKFSEGFLKTPEGV